MDETMAAAENCEQGGDPSRLDVFKDGCFDIQGGLEAVKPAIIVLRDEGIDQVPGLMPKAVGEAKANLTLAFRHIEDASMRLGKVVQAVDGGKSCYPR